MYPIKFTSFSSICEMVSKEDNSVPNAPNIDVNEITKGDDDPMFVTVEVIRSRVKSGNNRVYDDNVVKQIAELLPGTPGYLGHQDPSKRSFEFREPHSLYVGSVVKTDQTTGQVRALGKAYIYKNSPLREYIRTHNAANNPLCVSIEGEGSGMRGTGDTTIITRIDRLKSVDWANPQTAGLPDSKILSIMTEMIDEGGNNMDPKEVIKNVTLTEIKAYNPAVVDGLVKGITLAELRASNPTVVQEIENAVRVSEMTLKVEGTEKKVPLTEIQGIITAAEATISEMKAMAGLEKHLQETLEAEVSEEHRDRVKARISLVPSMTKDKITEMVKAEVAYITEISGTSGTNNKPRGKFEHKPNDEPVGLSYLQEMFGTTPKKEDK